MRWFWRVVAWWRRVIGGERALREQFDQDMRVEQQATRFFRQQADALAAQVNSLSSHNLTLEHQVQDAERRIRFLRGQLVEKPAEESAN